MATAADYVASGLALVSIPTGQKGPSSKGWQRPENAMTDPQRASALRGNIGLAHAYSRPRTMALDIDDLPKARKWLDERGVDLDALLEADDGVQISSGRRGRAKLLYRLPPGCAPIRTRQITDPETGEVMLEFRCASASGLTVQDVLPPSIHPVTGMPYRWAGKGTWKDIPQVPEAPQLAAGWPDNRKKSLFVMQLVLGRLGFGVLDRRVRQSHLGVTPFTGFHVTPSVTPIFH
ncbi:MAG: hypothetical protein RL519_819 [Pseudomonadota bacterium]|jgi:hypothetical protein